MNYLVTGANGLLGQALVRYLLAQGASVHSFDLQAYPDERVQSHVGDLRDPNAVLQACAGIDVVIHSASVVYVGLGKPQQVYDINVTGTQHIIQACVAQGVGRLVYTSSIDVVFEGQPIRQGDESLPYAQKPLDYYSETKILAEQAVLAADGKAGLHTCALRTAGIYGAGDRHRFPALITQAKAGRLARIGAGKSRFTHVYVENAAHAHYLAANALTVDSGVAGQAYFITDHAPQNFFDFAAPFLVALGLPAPKQVIPCRLAQGLAQVLEWRWRLFPTAKNAEVVLTRYSVASVCQDFWFTSAKAEHDFGYAPIVDEQTAFERTVAWLRSLL
jgi:nucleoside-diphosphate-sugar epimerase